MARMRPAGVGMQAFPIWDCAGQQVFIFIYQPAVVASSAGDLRRMRRQERVHAEWTQSDGSSSGSGSAACF